MARAAKGGDAAVLPLFDCSSSAPSPLIAGMLTRLLAGEDPLPHAFTGACVQLCRYPTVFSSSFSSHSSLLLLLKSLNSLDDLLTSGNTPQKVREEVEECVEWLHCLEVYCYRFIIIRPAAERETVRAEAERLLSWLRLVLSHLEPLPHLLLSSHQRSCDCHMTRLSLHIHWTAVAVSFRLAPLTGWRLFLEQATLSLSCLLSHAASLPLPTLSLGLPGCVCLRELWLLLQHCLDLSPATSFWAVVSSLVTQTITQPQSRLSDETVVISPGDPILFGWWCVEQGAHLYGWSEDGREQEERDLVSHWEIVHHLLPLTFKPGAKETQLKMALRVCVSLTHLWTSPSSSTPCLSAWEYFYRHIDDQFLTGTASINEWATPEGSSPSHWFRYLLSLFHSTNTQSHTHTNEPRPLANDSFQLFLCLICVTMETSSDEGKWRSLKGKFYSKLYRRWLCERKGAGLQRVLSLLLTLAWAGDCREVAVKSVSLLSQSGLAEPTESSCLLWKAVFAMMLILLEKRQRLDDVIAKLHPALASLVKPCPPESHDHQWKTVGVVLDGTVELMETGLDLGAGNLIGTHFSELLTSMEGTHLTRVLGVVESLCSLLSSATSSPSTTSSAVTSLWQCCSQPLLSLAHLPLPPSSLSSTLAAITALTCHQSHAHHFGLNLYHELTRDTISPLLSSAYVGHVIENDVIRHHILATENTQLQALHVWFRCLAELDHTPSATPTGRSSLLLQLTDLLTKLPMVSSLLGNQTTPSDPMTMLKCLLEAMETSYINLEGLGGEWRERLRVVVGEMTHYLEPSVAGARGPSAIRHAYHLAGLVVSMAPRLTYSRADCRCLLPRLLDWLVLPLSSSSSRPQPQGAAPAIRANLHLYLTGLLKLGPVRDDFVRRKVKQLFSRYFHDCCQPRSPLLPPSQNPFLLALQPWFGTSYHGDGEALGVVMEVVASQALSLPQQPSSLSPTLLYIKNVVEHVRIPSLLVTMATPLISHMTSCLLACDVCPSHSEPPGIRTLVMDILRPLLTSCKDHQNLLPCSSLVPPLVSYIHHHHQSTDHTHLAKPLRAVADLYPDLLQMLISCVADDKDLRAFAAHLQNFES